MNEEWETSDLRDTFSRRFFFVLFKYDENGGLVLRKVEFWSMPVKDMQEVERVWKLTVQRIASGKSDDLPKKSDSYVCHVRPHARNADDTDEDLNGRKFVKKCFWLNARYISDQIARDLD